MSVLKECQKLQDDFKTPVISGNVSFYNETEGVTVNPSPVIGVAGKMDIKDIRTSEFKNDWRYNCYDWYNPSRT